MAESTFPFRRYTSPLKVPVAASATNVDVPAGFIKPEYNAFYVANANICWVRLTGSLKDGTPLPASEDNGWLFPPGFVGVFSTQKPVKLSCLAVARPGYPLPAEYVPLELSYGVGA